MNSYEIACKILELRGLNDEGLIDEVTFEDTLEGLGVDDKLNGLIYASKRIKNEMEMLKEEKKRIDQELKRQEKNNDKIKGLIELLMSAAHKNKFDGVAGKLSYRKSKSIECTNDFVQAHINDNFIIKDINYKIDKKALKNAIEKFGAIDGAIVVEHNNLQIK